MVGACTDCELFLILAQLCSRTKLTNLHGESRMSKLNYSANHLRLKGGEVMELDKA